jgi:hypothetical protein
LAILLAADGVMDVEVGLLGAAGLAVANASVGVLIHQGSSGHSDCCATETRSPGSAEASPPTPAHAADRAAAEFRAVSAVRHSAANGRSDLLVSVRRSGVYGTTLTSTFRPQLGAIR